jgi:hypothetical protein
VEKLVEVAHAVEKQHVRMLRLDPQVLLHHGRVRGVRLHRRFGFHAASDYTARVGDR